MAFEKILIPENGEKITMAEDGRLNVPDHPVVAFIEGDGSGPDIWPAVRKILDEAVGLAYSGKRRIAWMELYAGEKAWNMYGRNDDAWLPAETLEAFREYLVGIRGPLATPAGGDASPLNEALYRQLDLYTRLRPVKYIAGMPSPLKRPEDVEMVIFRENSGDIYAGIEWAAGTAEAGKVIEFLRQEMGVDRIRFPESGGIGVRSVAREGTERLVRAAIRYAIDNKRKSVTFIHKGDAMQCSEGGFRRRVYELARSEFAAREIDGGPWCELPEGIVIRDILADTALQQVLTRAAEFDVIATLNLDGDFLSAALAAQVGGIAPGATINYGTGHAIFEAMHGTEPEYAGRDMANPLSLALSAELMLRYMGWDEAAELVLRGVTGAIAARTVTSDLHRLMEDAILLGTSGFADAVIAHMQEGGQEARVEDQYDQLAARFKELFESGAEKSSEFAQSAMEKARQQLTAAGLFSDAQGRNLKKFLERDFAHIAASMRDEAMEKLNPARVSAGALASLSSMLKMAGNTLSGFAQKAERANSCRSGEITSAGTLHCLSCEHELHFRKTGRVPPCPKCHSTEFSKSY